jgi:hypothetical protein
MKFYLLEDPNKYKEYARFSHRGTWTDGKLCEKCGLDNSILVDPLQIEWEPDSDQIGDFSWCGYTSVVQEKVKKYLIDTGQDCDYGEVIVLPPPKVGKKKIVNYPYDGPNLYWLKANVYIDLDIEKSETPLLIDCAYCGQKKYKFRRNNLMVNVDSWSGEHIFQLKQFKKSSATYVTQELLFELIDQGFENIGYIEAGKII